MTNLVETYRGLGADVGRERLLAGAVLGGAGSLLVVGSLAAAVAGSISVTGGPAALAGLGLLAALIGGYVPLADAEGTRQLAAAGTGLGVLAVALFAHAAPAGGPVLTGLSVLVYGVGLAATGRSLVVAARSLDPGTRRPPGETVTLEVTRGDETRAVEVDRDDLPGAIEAAKAEGQDAIEAAKAGGRDGLDHSEWTADAAGTATAAGTGETATGTDTDRAVTAADAGRADDTDRAVTAADAGRADDTDCAATDEGTIEAGGQDAAEDATPGVGRAAAVIDRVDEDETGDGDESIEERTAGAVRSTDASTASDAAEAATPTSDGGVTEPGVRTPADDAEVMDARSDPEDAADDYCGNCEHFDYVQTSRGMRPFCEFHDGIMDDMDACEEWTPNGME